MSGSLPALQQHAESTDEAFCQRYVQPPKKKLRRGRVRLSRCDSTSTHSQRQKPGNFYRRRDHEASPFFKVVRDNFDKFEDVYPERYLLDEHKINDEIAGNMRCWKHSGFSVDNSVRIAKGDKTGMQRLVQYIARCPFSLTRMVSITKDGKILYRASHTQCIPFPLSGDETLMKDLPRNYELYDPLDFLAEVTQHIPKPQMTQKKQWRSH